MTTRMTNCSFLPDEDLETEMIDSRHLVSADDDLGAGFCAANMMDDNSYHTLEVDDTELAEYPTHLALVLKRPKVGKNGIVEPDNLEETYAFVDLKYFMPISANKYIMKSHVNLDEPGVAFTLPHFPMSSFMGEADPTTLTYCATNSNLGYYESSPVQQQMQPETVLLTSDVDGVQRSISANSAMLMAHHGGQMIHNGSQIQYQSAPTTCGQTIIQSYPAMSPPQQQQPIYSQMTYSNEVYCGGGPSSTSSSPPITSCSHDQVVPSVGNSDSPSPPAIPDHQHSMQEQARIILPCPMGCADHSVHHQQQLQPQQLQQQHLQQQQQVLRSSPPSGVQLQIRGPGIGKICTTSASMTSTSVTENIISVSSTSATTKVIVEAAKTIPIEGQADLQHMQHHQGHASLQEIKELDFSMF